MKHPDRYGPVYWGTLHEGSDWWYWAMGQVFGEKSGRPEPRKEHYSPERISVESCTQKEYDVYISMALGRGLTTIAAALRRLKSAAAKDRNLKPHASKHSSKLLLLIGRPPTQAHKATKRSG